MPYEYSQVNEERMELNCQTCGINYLRRLHRRGFLQRKIYAFSAISHGNAQFAGNRLCSRCAINAGATPAKNLLKARIFDGRRSLC